MNFKQLSDLDLRGKRVLIRQDLNVPLKQGVVTSSKRIDASLPTIKFALDAGAKVMLMSHLGRPIEGEKDDQYSLAPVARYLSKVLDKDVKLDTNYLDTGPVRREGEVILLELIRGHVDRHARMDEPLVLPGPDLLASIPQNPAAHIVNEAGIFRQGYELGW